MSLVIDCEWLEPGLGVTEYMKGYVSKRSSDAAGATTQLPDGGLRYKVPVNLPLWVTRMLALPTLYFTEDVTWVGDTAHIRAECTGADVAVNTVISPCGTGTKVATVVDVVPEYKGVGIPHALVRRVVRHLFNKECRRDVDYATARGQSIP